MAPLVKGLRKPRYRTNLPILRRAWISIHTAPLAVLHGVTHFLKFTTHTRGACGCDSALTAPPSRERVSTPLSYGSAVSDKGSGDGVRIIIDQVEIVKIGKRCY